MRYVFLDTNVYVTCARLRKQGHDHRLIERLAASLAQNGAFLVVPELVSAELERHLTSAIAWTRGAIKAYEESVAVAVDGLHARHPLEADAGLEEPLAAIDASLVELRKVLHDRLAEREKALKLARAAIRAVFKNERIVVDAPLTPWAMTRAMVQTVRGSRTAVASETPRDGAENGDVRFKFGIEADQMILESLVEFMDGKSDEDVVIICSDDTKFYVTKGDRKLRREVASRFKCQVRGFAELPTLLSDEFGATTSPQVAKEYADIAKQFAAAHAITFPAGMVGKYASTMDALSKEGEEWSRVLAASSSSLGRLSDLGIRSVLADEAGLATIGRSIAASTEAMRVMGQGVSAASLLGTGLAGRVADMYVPIKLSMPVVDMAWLKSLGLPPKKE